MAYEWSDINIYEITMLHLYGRCYVPENRATADSLSAAQDVQMGLTMKDSLHFQMLVVFTYFGLLTTLSIQFGKLPIWILSSYCNYPVRMRA
ncbi:MAG: hypothetical protein Q7T74_05795 [Candidatus Saccharibacteria bacterium]|jgi:ABC-type branched-subunit amino acid transport system ATPase component|nr:hypothetical protein [Candidatus Saccharibacteria bacterium]